MTAGATASPLKAPNGPHPDPQSSQREVLLNGLPIATRQTAAGDRVAVVCVVRAGSMFDPAGKSGLAAMTANLLAAGAGSYTGDRIKAELEDAGAKLDVDVRWDGVWFRGEAPAAGLTPLLDVLSLMVTAPRFNAADVDAYRKAAVDRAKVAANDPERVADLAEAKALYGTHTYGRSIDGDAASLASITPADVKLFFAKFYVANASALAIVGPQSQDSVLKLARPRFGRWSQGKVVPATFLPPARPTATKVFVVDWPGLDRAVVRAGFFAAGRASSGAVSIADLHFPLAQEIRTRDRKLDAGARFDLRALDSPFVVSFKAAPTDVPAGLQTTVEAMKSLQEGRPTAQNTGALGGYTQDQEAAYWADALATADFYATQKIATGREPHAASDADIYATAKSVLRPEALTVVAVGDAAALTEALKKAGYTVEAMPKP